MLHITEITKFTSQLRHSCVCVGGGRRGTGEGGLWRDLQPWLFPDFVIPGSYCLLSLLLWKPLRPPEAEMPRLQGAWQSGPGPQASGEPGPCSPDFLTLTACRLRSREPMTKQRQNASQPPNGLVQSIIIFIFYVKHFWFFNVLFFQS